mmetsp:Transcript_15095/g.31714  ORF Transcript_15095/g.31714 Transcript_15095/m.31714 type:complete len:103 (+) Transcript_15095:433-741(+)
MTMWTFSNKLYLLNTILQSTIAFLLYGYDKYLSRKYSRRRLRENNLHFFSILGGYPGALLAQKLFRHKTRKRKFLLVFWGGVVLHFVVVGVVVVFLRQFTFG